MGWFDNPAKKFKETCKKVEKDLGGLADVLPRMQVRVKNNTLGPVNIRIDGNGSTRYYTIQPGAVETWARPFGISVNVIAEHGNSVKIKPTQSPHKLMMWNGKLCDQDAQVGYSWDF